MLSLPWLFASTVSELLAERCDAGDVQTCVCVCQVLRSVTNTRVATTTAATTEDTQGGHGRRLLLVDLVSTPSQRGEWYWWYDGLLRRLGLPVQANDVALKSLGVDEEDDDDGEDDDGDADTNGDDSAHRKPPSSRVAAGVPPPQTPVTPRPRREVRAGSLASVNTDSTTFYSQCGKCRKPVPATTASKKGMHSWCSKCQAPLSTCVLCRQPVLGLYVACPGCGHGGHLRHLKLWFEGKGRSMCPSGCGHQCDFKAMLA